jgi:hypothetical protein
MISLDIIVFYLLQLMIHTGYQLIPEQIIVQQVQKL